MTFMKTIALILALSIPVMSFGATVEITNLVMTTRDGQVIHAGDATGKMVPIVGGKDGRKVLHVLLQRSHNEDLSDMQRVIAKVLTKMLIKRWHELSQQN